MIKFNIQKELIIKIFEYDNTYYERYKLCINELSNFKNIYPKKDAKIIMTPSIYSIYTVIYYVNDYNINNYNKFILNYLKNKKFNNYF